MLRPIEAQFEAEVASRIRALAHRVAHIRYSPGASRYYGLELIACLEAGALLASLIVASALMELHIRSLVVHYSTRAASRLDPQSQINFEAKLEKMRDRSFSDLVKALADVELIDHDDAKKAERHYRQIRIPLLHGLPRRFVDLHFGDLLQDVWPGRQPVSVKEIEEIIEDHALDTLESIVDIIERSAF